MLPRARVAKEGTITNFGNLKMAVARDGRSVEMEVTKIPDFGTSNNRVVTQNPRAYQIAGSTKIEGCTTQSRLLRVATQ